MCFAPTPSYNFQDLSEKKLTKYKANQILCLFLDELHKKVWASWPKTHMFLSGLTQS